MTHVGGKNKTRVCVVVCVRMIEALKDHILLTEM